MFTQASDPLSRAVDEALAGQLRPLLDLLERGSRLPGLRANDSLAEAFAQACRLRGALADRVAFELARLSADEAPGATSAEFLPVCGLRALGARAAADASIRTRVLAELHLRADDLRYRVRDAVVEALARIGAAMGDDLAAAVASWMDGYFHAAAVVRALGEDSWLVALRDPGPALARLDEAFRLSRDAPRAAARYPGRKALVEALVSTPGLLALRLGVPVFDVLARWSAVQDPELRDAIRSILSSRKLARRFGPELQGVRHALSVSEPPVRNPDHDVGPTRDRSRARRRR
ncbi:MAG: hypothetical protein ABSC94_12165 [Polyangiaceae bacterium]|jgi:hypothetical protein